MAKDKVGKPRLSLIYYSFMQEIAKVREFGIEKYGHSEDWRGVEDLRESYFDAAIRHLIKAKSAELDDNTQFSKKDFESGLTHLSHAAACIMYLIEDDHDIIKHGQDCPIGDQDEV